MKSCSFFGHREIDDSIDDTLHQYIEYAINTLGMTTFYIGNHSAFDAKIATIMRDIRKKHPQIKLILNCIENKIL